MRGAYRRNRDRTERLAQDSLAQSSNDGVRRAFINPLSPAAWRVLVARVLTTRADRAVR